MRIRRAADQKNDIWTVFNVIQENLIKGGIWTRNKETGQTRRSIEVKSPVENNRLNIALWQLTEHMAALKK